MTRVTPQTSTANATAWESDRWYAVTLKEDPEIQPKGSPGYKGEPRKNPRLEVVWSLVAVPDDWIFDWFDLVVGSQRDGTPAKAKLLMCALADRDPRREATPWLDPETLEYGWGADWEHDTPDGRIVKGILVAVKGDVVKDQGGVDRLKVTRYGNVRLAGVVPSAAAVASGGTAGPQLSPDGHWQWNGTAWVPATAPAPPPPTQGTLI